MRHICMKLAPAEGAIAHLLGTPPKHKEHGINDIGLAAAIGAHNRGE